MDAVRCLHLSTRLAESVFELPKHVEHVTKGACDATPVPLAYHAPAVGKEEKLLVN